MILCNLATEANKIDIQQLRCLRLNSVGNAHFRFRDMALEKRRGNDSTPPQPLVFVRYVTLRYWPWSR